MVGEGPNLPPTLEEVRRPLGCIPGVLVLLRAIVERFGLTMPASVA